MDLGLDGKAVVITGAPRRDRPRHRRAFAAEVSRLGLIDVDDALRELQRWLGIESAAVEADLSTRGGVETSIAHALEGLGGAPDVLFNSVGTGYVRTLDDLSDEDPEATLNRNFYSYLRAIRAVLPAMRERGSGTIINLW